MADTQHPMAIIARMAHSPKVAARFGRDSGLDITVNQVRAIRDLQDKRRRLKGQDSLIGGALRLKAKLELARRQRYYENLQRAEDDRRQRAASIRSTLLRAARVARAMGLSVRASKMHGRVSSYYVTGVTGPTVRISDHEIPETPRREFMAQEHGSSFFSGYHGPQILIDRERSATWLRRAILLACHHRRVPGA